MKQRLDKTMYETGLTESREKARALIMEGKVLVDGLPATKAGSQVREGSDISLLEPACPFVSRGGIKLLGAIERFGLSLTGKTAMDVGASTGGFTDCMLSLGAKKIYAIDVGYGQFDWKLRGDARVVLLEKTNIRGLTKAQVPGGIDLAAVDVSFISLTKVLPHVVEFLRPGGEIIALIKPQFEAGRADVGKGGIVRDEAARGRAVQIVRDWASGAGMQEAGLMESPIKGQKGNVEYLIYLKVPQGKE